ncbi:MAG: hypothetical protein AMQ22_00249 [Candidatus Methanofastidiosum methylothiophilum]|uniref:SHOCT domain-containing protein n=1 Tax=Candidatus Methanofastidiosum methylothiophilum TaxID=1705564 RepID=A0A150J8B7_9EURY|nr:MAG: hypothetical protein AMQ22_00249 [Candidatus Methanofastidiosum methylthiophilus]
MEIKLLERSYSRGEISWEELISRKRDLFVQRSAIPKRDHPKRKKEPEIDLSNKNNGLIALFVLTVIVLLTFFFVSGSV